VRAVENADVMPIERAGEIVDDALGAGSNLGTALSAVVEGIGSFLGGIFGGQTRIDQGPGRAGGR